MYFPDHRESVSSFYDNFSARSTAAREEKMSEKAKRLSQQKMSRSRTALHRLDDFGTLSLEEQKQQWKCFNKRVRKRISKNSHIMTW
jgi:hypothetical protein